MVSEKRKMIHDDSNPFNLHDAAEELIKLASALVSSESLIISKEILNCLKLQSSNSLSVKESIDSLKTLIDSNHQLLYESLWELKTCIAHQTKNQKLEWAFTNAEIGSFQYKDKGSLRVSTDLVKDILMNFRQGYAYELDKSYILDGDPEIFRKALIDQIRYLTGQIPRIEFDMIYYE